MEKISVYEFWNIKKKHLTWDLHLIYSINWCCWRNGEMSSRNKKIYSLGAKIQDDLPTSFQFVNALIWTIYRWYHLWFQQEQLICFGEPPMRFWNKWWGFKTINLVFGTLDVVLESSMWFWNHTYSFGTIDTLSELSIQFQNHQCDFGTVDTVSEP